MGKESFDLWKVEKGSSAILASSSSKSSLQGKLDNGKFVEEEVRHFRDLDLEPKIVEHRDHLWGLSGIDILGFQGNHVKPSKKCSFVVLPHEEVVSENRRIPLALAMGMKGGSREFAQAIEAGRFATVTGSFC